MKNIAILTLGLRHNYGGILQATALYNFLKSEGYNPILLRKYPIQKKWKAILIKILERLPFQNFKGVRNSYIKYNNNIHFFDEYMPNQTEIMTYKSQIEEFLNRNEIDTVIVGSDQVWRYAYINDTEYDTYFLNFNLNRRIKKISYAASFGVDTWKAPIENNNIKKYLSDFNAVSVRESSGQEICKKDFGRDNAELVLDPTLLIEQSFYSDMIKNKSQESYDCITYILDENAEKNELVRKINIECQHKSVFNLLEKNSTYSVQDWVSSFKMTNFVITDSFHGMVFSIIFNKQFVVLINKDRGADRFFSLCHLLGLEDRLFDPTQGGTFNAKTINYSDINERLASLRKSSKKFLLNALGE
ncbi:MULTISPECIES: polysaccharide pyruvyl transferase family protein [unclassified Acinetobacter]|uniref:polysaccharide pyruvyl transferase family protein n=1 Tax=unclassified Acinetobacter TaxID=196816 RepID=UPI001C23838E|nr:MULTISPECIES: polysaccharide pyruvyl transferase family protein [unclassified Acinetobacter]